MSEPFEFRCEDLSQDGVVLIPPSSPQFDVLLDDIGKRSLKIEAAYPGFFQGRTASAILPGHRETSAVLMNQSGKAIAMMQMVWRVVRFDGRSYVEASQFGNDKSLLPFGMNPDMLKLFSYWYQILPGSKRYLGRGHLILGDNGDVRPPQSDEIWKRGSYITTSGSGLQELSGPIRAITLSLDGVFFADGQFVGPNTRKLFEEVFWDAEAHKRIAKMAQEGLANGEPPDSILRDIETVTGPKGERPPRGIMPSENTMAAAYEKHALEKLAHKISGWRHHADTDGIVRGLADWAKAEVPDLRG